MEPLERDVGEDVREPVPELRVEPAPEGERAADHVLPEPALRLVQRGRAARCERCPVELGLAAVLVQAVADLVHGREQRVAVEVVLGVSRREADVAGSRARCRTDAPSGRAGSTARRCRRRARRRRESSCWALARVRAARGTPRARRRGAAATRSRRAGLSRSKTVRTSSVFIPRLEVVQQHVVGIVGRREAVDVPVLELERAVEPRAEALVVVVGPRLRPRIDALGRELRQVGRELGRHATRLLPVASGDCDQARVVGVGIELRLERAERRRAARRSRRG